MQLMAVDTLCKCNMRLTLATDYHGNALHVLAQDSDILPVGRIIFKAAKIFNATILKTIISPFLRRYNEAQT